MGRSLPDDVRWLVEHVTGHEQDAFTVRQFFGTLGEGLCGSSATRRTPRNGRRWRGDWRTRTRRWCSCRLNARRAKRS